MRGERLKELLNPPKSKVPIEKFPNRGAIVGEQSDRIVNNVKGAGRRSVSVHLHDRSHAEWVREEECYKNPKQQERARLLSRFLRTGLLGLRFLFQGLVHEAILAVLPEPGKEFCQ